MFSLNVILDEETTWQRRIKKLNNSFQCIDSPADDDFGGCDGITNWPIGRDVKAFEPGSVVSHTQAETFNIEVGFVGCAK